MFSSSFVEGVSAIVWKWLPTEADKKKCKALKDKTGLEYKDLPKLDMRMTALGLKYCDIIIRTNKISEWHTAVKEFLKKKTIEGKDINGGLQIQL